MKNKYNN